MLSLTITLLVNHPSGYIVGRFDLGENITWSFVAHRFEWVALLWTLTHAPQTFLKVTIKHEELLNA